MKRVNFSTQFYLLLILLFPHEGLAHSGNTDPYGGHFNSDNGTYHCHSGKCLDVAWEEALKVAFPLGQEDGQIGKNRSEEYSNQLHSRVLNGAMDQDEAEYMIPYLLKAYEMGYEDTYVPAFWEKYKWYIIGLLIIVVIYGARFGMEKYNMVRDKRNVSG